MCIQAGQGPSELLSLLATEASAPCLNLPALCHAVDNRSWWRLSVNPGQDRQVFKKTKNSRGGRRSPTHETIAHPAPNDLPQFTENRMRKSKWACRARKSITIDESNGCNFVSICKMERWVSERHPKLRGNRAARCGEDGEEGVRCSPPLCADTGSL